MARKDKEIPLTEAQTREIAMKLSSLASGIREINAHCESAKELLDTIGDFSALDEASETVNADIAEIADDFDEARAGLEAQIESANEQLESVFLPLRDTLDETLTRGGEILDQTGARVDEVEREVARIDALVGELDSRREQLFQSLRDAFEGATEEALETGEEARDALSEWLDVAKESIAEMKTEIGDFLSETTQTVNEALEAPVRALEAQITERLDALCAQLTDVVHEQTVGFVVDNIEQAIRQAIDDIIEQARDAIMGLLDSVEGDSRESESRRQELQAALDLLEPALDPVMGALDHIRGLAGSVGISI